MEFGGEGAGGISISHPHAMESYWQGTAFALVKLPYGKHSVWGDIYAALP